MTEDDRSADARFESLYDRTHSAVAAYCRRRVGPGHVDDVVAETFTVAWRRIDEVPPGPEALMWLYRVAYRAIGHQWRSRDRQQRVTARLSAVPEPPVALPDQAAITRDEVDRVLAAAERLGELDAEVLRLRYWEQLSNEEIAGVLGLTSNAVGQRLHRARRNLTKEFNRLERRDRRQPDGGTR